ncbi:uncharacterized protein LOC116847749 [Odontomachus brunneus]|uniref:uncharacterized protein LOC116847749 n=1 Tax=Odontomachus brunneus TaxID=486640 RepID=UPI0013F20210|nr:uncharacterized protein LOC116847749 [Odontomachus brunneus]
MQHHKIIERPHDLLQFRRDAMMISFIVILSLVVRAISSSLSVQGSLSTLDDDTVSIDLFANKSNDGVDELVEKLHGTKRIRLIIDFVGKIINIQQEINDRIDRHQNYLVVTFNGTTTLINIVGPETMNHAMRSAILRKLDSINTNVATTALKEISCKTLFNDFIRSIISRMCKINLIDDESKSSINRDHKKIRYDTITGGKIAPKIETRILRYSALTDTGGNNSEESSVTNKIPVGRKKRPNKINEFAVIISNFTNNNSTFKMSRNKDLSTVKTGFMDREIVSEQKNFRKGTFNDNSFATKLGDLEDQFTLLKETPTFPLDKDIIKSNQIVNEKRKEALTNTISPILFQGNVTNVPKIFSRRTFQLPWNVPWSKDQNMQNQPHVSETKMDKMSAMDEILEAVHQVLPTKKSAKIPSKKSKMTFGVS